MGWDLLWQMPLQAGLARQSANCNYASLFDWPPKWTSVSVPSWRQKSEKNVLMGHKAKLLGHRTKGKTSFCFYIEDPQQSLFKWMASLFNSTVSEVSLRVAQGASSTIFSPANLNLQEEKKILTTLSPLDSVELPGGWHGKRSYLLPVGCWMLDVQDLSAATVSGASDVQWIKVSCQLHQLKRRKNSSLLSTSSNWTRN